MSTESRIGRAGLTAGLLCLAIIGTIDLAEADPAEADPVRNLIAQAGNADDDSVRLETLRKLQKTPGLDAGLKADVENMDYLEAPAVFRRRGLPHQGFRLQDRRTVAAVSA
jgi:hypothetical protein